MLYLVFVLTFLAGILFYALSPRDDQTQLNMYRAEGFVAAMLGQHQAAKDYITHWLGIDTTDHVRADASYFSLTRDNHALPPGRPYNFLRFAPNSMVMEISDDQGDTNPSIGGSADTHYKTTVFCLKANGDLTNCGNTGTPNPSDAVTDRYLLTYTGAHARPAWWPDVQNNKQRRYGSWRTSFANRTRGSYNCGTMTCTIRDPATGACSGKWCVDNGQNVYTSGGVCGQEIPSAITQQLGCNGANYSNMDTDCYDTLVCISRIKQSPKRYYAPGLTAFYDGINNNNVGAEGERQTSEGNWVDMMTGTVGRGNFTGGDFNYFATHVTLPIYLAEEYVGPFHNFTLTMLLQQDNIGDYGSLFQYGKIRVYLRYVVEDGYDVKITEECGGGNNEYTAHIPMATGLDQPIPIISLTFMGKNDRLEVYANASPGPVLTVMKGAISCTAGEFQDMYIDPDDSSGVARRPLKVISEHIRVFGVRYYADKRLTTLGKMSTSVQGHTPSELEQNFKMDSKRYGIATICDMHRLNNCLKVAENAAEINECYNSQRMCPRYD